MVTFRIEIINSSQEGVANIFARTLSRKRYLQQLVSAGRIGLYLTLPVKEFQLLGFVAYEKLY
jgi:hypothetical protein